MKGIERVVDGTGELVGWAWNCPDCGRCGQKSETLLQAANALVIHQRGPGCE